MATFPKGPARDTLRREGLFVIGINLLAQDAESLRGAEVGLDQVGVVEGKTWAPASRC